MPSDRVVIVGAGPTGLGAAHRLVECGHERFDLYEASDQVGGLATSVCDPAGFVWDMGGHVQFSHYRYFRDLMDALLGDDWLTHERVASIWIADRLVPYPLQHHLACLPDALREECERGLERARSITHEPPTNFREWILATFGSGIAELFMLPYNHKVWAYPAERLSHLWVADRVAHAATEDVARDKRQQPSWGPNRTFRFPVRGGTGEIWRRLAQRLPKARVHLSRRVVKVAVEAREVVFSDGTRQPYDRLVSTIPLDVLVQCAGLEELEPFGRDLLHSSVHVIGVGLRGSPPAKIAQQCWMYFPGDDCPFYRATVFSNYSPNNAPAHHWSLMLEVSESPRKTVDRKTLAANVIDGLLTTGLISNRDQVADVWQIRLEHGYPTPSVGRDAALANIQPALEAVNIYSRGRFGAWKYEVSNQDHSLMQGVELVDRLMHGAREITLHDAAAVNAPGLREHPVQVRP